MVPEPPPASGRESDEDDLLPESDLARAFTCGGDDDAGTSSSAPSLLDRIAKAVGARPAVSLRDVERPSELPTLREGEDGDVEAAGKYVVQGELGRGGVGTVHRGHDQDLGRDVAMKFLHDKYRDDPDVVHRFVEEAQIGGQLQHPGIVPVYDLGLADGRPYFAMKLVKGRTLAEELAGRDAPSSDRRRFLSIFEQVCQTMAYAHARGVVHRDLKPANVMIGAFGEVQVVDWGMGKVLGHAARPAPVREPVSERAVATVRSSKDSSTSLVGAVMGTPQYMSPEQASGRVDRMDERSDVFSLGAILCELLTGEPPYLGERRDVLESAAAARLDPAHARLAACGADEGIVAVVRRCLAPEPDGRPRTASVLAAEVQAYLASAEERAHRATVRAAALKRTQRLGVTLIGVIALGLATSLWFWRDADRQRVFAAESAQQAKTSLANFDRLSYFVRLEVAKASRKRLLPIVPERFDEVRGWLDDEAGTLVAALPDLRATLVEIEGRTPEVGPAVAGAAPVDDADNFLHATVAELVRDIEAFEADEVREVRARLDWAERVAELMTTRDRPRWEAARDAIRAADGVTASELYAESPIELSPQFGLVPIGMNPASKLWEFLHVRSGGDPARGVAPGDVAIPTHAPDGTLPPVGSGIVFVLVPGGTFTMGAQSDDPGGRMFDASAAWDEQPVEAVQLAPYFLSKWEMTQGQWVRLSGGENPSWYQQGADYPGVPVAVGDAHPVEQVQWPMAVELLQRYQLALPTEAQWERGARGGTETPWPSGRDPDSVAGFGNVFDRTAAEATPQWPAAGFDDGFDGLAPVATYRPNPFGLHDVHGNVAEWCREWFGSYSTPASPGDGFRDQQDVRTAERVLRGGSFTDDAVFSRCANRNPTEPWYVANDIGVRPVRALDP